MPINIQVVAREGESVDCLLKRFSKKCKKEDIIKEYLEKTSFFKTKSEKRRQKRLDRQFFKKNAKK